MTRNRSEVVLRNPYGTNPVPTIERDASEALTPGELVEIDSDSEFTPHATAGGGPVMPIVVKEEPFEDLSTDVDSGDRTVGLQPRPGDVLFMFLADGENVSEGDALESDGAGALQAHGTASTGDEDNVVGYADEDLNNTSGSRSRIAVRFE